MSTLDATVSMMSKCTEEELLAIQQVIIQFVYARENKTVLTREQFMEELKISREQYKNGQYKEAEEVLQEMRSKYAV